MAIINFVIQAFHNSLQNSFSNLYLIIILNLFFLFATYTDLKYMKIYDKFNAVMLTTRLLSFFIIGGFKFDYLFGGIILFAVFLLGAVMTGDNIAGDIKFAGNIGLWCGLIPSVIIIFFTLLLNLIFRFVFKLKKKIPLAPYFYAGYIILGLYFFLCVY